MKEKVYENRVNKPFENERELKKQIESVWKNIAFNLPEIRKAIKVCWKIKSGQRKRRSTYENDLLLRFFRTLIFVFV